MGRLIEGALASPRTTIAGNALSAASYFGNVGFKLPSNEGEWVQFAISALIAVLSLLMKDN